jgi:hypothetical protein
MTINITTLCIKLHYIVWHNAECRDLYIVMLNPIMLNVIMLNVIMLRVIMASVIMLNVVMLNVVMLNVLMLNIIMLNVVMLIVVVLNVQAPKRLIYELIKKIFLVENIVLRKK